MNLSIYLFFYSILIMSITGYGLLFQNILKNISYIEFEYNLLGSLLFLIFLSFLTHFFFNHGYVHNLIILKIGIISFIFFFFKKKGGIQKISKLYLFNIWNITICIFDI